MDGSKTFDLFPWDIDRLCRRKKTIDSIPTPVSVGSFCRGCEITFYLHPLSPLLVSGLSGDVSGTESPDVRPDLPGGPKVGSP